MSAATTNPLIDDRDVELILDEVIDLGRLLRLPYFADHDRETCELLLASARGLARDQLYPAYRALDAEPPRLVDGRVVVHPGCARCTGGSPSSAWSPRPGRTRSAARRCRSRCSRSRPLCRAGEDSYLRLDPDWL
jgi:hypothetical protein